MDSIKKELADKIQAAQEYLASELATIHSGRANAGLLDKILVDSYGQKMPISNLATITVPDATQILVQPWDKVNIAAVEKAISSANMGLSVSNEGDRVRVSLPPLSSERRDELTKLVSRLAEEAKVSIRNARREALEALEKIDNIGEDNQERMKKEYQNIVDGATGKVEKMVDNKTEELKAV